MKPIAILLLLLLAGLPISAGELERVAVLLREATLRELSEPLATYVDDVERRFPVRMQVVTGHWEKPEEVRAAIKDLHQKQGVSGVILVGAMPMHRFYMHEFANPNPLYYEDFDLKFSDTNNDGFADRYQGEPQLKVWVANLRGSVKADDDAIDALRLFFAKTHKYYQAAEVIQPRALALSASDWPEGGTWFKNEVGDRLVGKEAITVLEDKACTLKAAEKALGTHNYTLRTFRCIRTGMRKPPRLGI